MVQCWLACLRDATETHASRRTTRIILSESSHGTGSSRIAHAACHDLMIVVRYSTGSDSGKAFTVKIEMYKWSIAKSRRSLTSSMKSLAEGRVLGSTPVRNGAGRSCEVGAMSRRLASGLALKLRVDGWPGFGDASDGDAWEERSI